MKTFRFPGLPFPRINPRKKAHGPRLGEKTWPDMSLGLFFSRTNDLSPRRVPDHLSKNPSWMFVLHLSNGQRYTLFGVYANDKVWPTDFRKLPDSPTTQYEECPKVAPKFKAALDAGKAWFEANIREEMCCSLAL
jgi:hypothetical protein